VAYLTKKEEAARKKANILLRVLEQKLRRGKWGWSFSCSLLQHSWSHTVPDYSLTLLH